MAGVQIEPLSELMRDEAARMMARAFVTNPLHIAAFGASQLEKNEAFFRIGLIAMKGPKLAATESSRILGLIHWVRSPACQFSAVEKLSMTPAMLKGFGVRSALHVGSWLSVWSAHDPHEPHIHLGPIGVDPEARGRRIGRQLMERYLDELDRAAQVGYLETDRPENVAFYSRFGFKTTGDVTVLGVRNFLMRRDARTKPT